MHLVMLFDLLIRFTGGHSLLSIHNIVNVHAPTLPKEEEEEERKKLIVRSAH